MFDWTNLNDSSAIPAEILARALHYTVGSCVIDFGSGMRKDGFVDFRGSHTARIDAAGLVASTYEAPRATLDGAITSAPAELPVTIVFFRVLSVLSHDEFENTVRSLWRQKERIASILIYDYTFNPSREAEYIHESTSMGVVHQLRTEWSAIPFSHYKTEQFCSSMPLPLVEYRKAGVPAVLRKLDRGIFLAFRRCIRC